MKINLIMLLLLTFKGYAQQSVTSHTANFEIHTISPTPDIVFHITASKPVAAVAVKSLAGSMDSSIIIANQIRYSIKPELENDLEGSVASQLLMLKQATPHLKILKGKLEGLITVYLFYQQPNLNITSAQRRISDFCDQIDAIPTATWREGLTPPKVRPDSTVVQHIIIHHSATEVADSNATAAVRYIYLYHTTVNGWDDIGYNYLISPNGTVYEGRDRQQVSATDNVKGAHFCGHNTNTMGICILGNYMNYSPYEASLRSLENLIAWKLKKENLPAFGSSTHPVGTSFALPVIAGHRDGYLCNTDCPGTFLYDRLSEIRTQSQAALEACVPTAVSNPSALSQPLLYPTPAVDFVYLPSAFLYQVTAQILNAQGSVVRDAEIVNNSVSVSDLPAGLYFLSVSTVSIHTTFRFVKVAEQ